MTEPVEDGRQVRTLAQAARVFFSQPGPRLIAAKAVAAWGARALLGPPGPRDVLAVVAVALWWPLQEWLAHKHLLHLVPRELRGKRFDPIFARRHRAHHRDPSNIFLTLLPVEVLYAAAPANVVLWLRYATTRRSALTGIAAFSTAALVYEWTHFLVHTSYPPKSAFYRRVWRNHRNHHYLNERYWLGFTWPWVDQVLGTEPDPKRVTRSATARDLHGLNDSDAHHPVKAA